MTTRIALSCMATAALVLSVHEARASVPAGTLARVDKVAYEPSKVDATRVRIDGVFSQHLGGAPFTYSEPVAGYMYYRCEAGAEDQCREQWQDIEAVIGKAVCAGWGELQKKDGEVRPASAPPADADLYPLGMGVTPMTKAGVACPKLLAFGVGGASSSSGGASPGSSSSSSGATSTSSSSSGGAGPVPSSSSGSPPAAPTSGDADSGSTGGGGCNTSNGSAPLHMVAGLGLLAIFCVARRRGGIAR